ncbi:MAG: Na/Pi cotransporter family protein [Planctomycetes bacterium]|nr:Na/Pi cotransporter family protein [Planctomycetota bacterium]
MEQMSGGLKAIAGQRLRAILGRLAGSRFAAVLSGACVTAVVQSSSLTTVLIVGFVGAGLMSLAQSIGVIMGANIGTTVTTQLIAFQVAEFALLLVAAGFVVPLVWRSEGARSSGPALIGVGLVFYGIGVMSDAMAPLRGYEPFLQVMVRLNDPLLAIAAGTVFTALVQSSAATTGAVIALAAQGVIAPPAGIALVFGANIGTCVTALLAALGKPRVAVRAALVHVLFNVIGVLLWFWFIDDLGALVSWLSPRAEELAGSARLAAEAPRQIANAHTVFNVSNALVLMWFTRPLAWLVERLVPDRADAGEEPARARYLDAAFISTPALALQRARLELLRLGEQVTQMFSRILPALLTGSRQDLTRVKRMDDPVDALHAQIIEYLGRISRQSLTRGNTEELLRLMSATTDLENIGDTIETNLVALGLSRLEHEVSVSAATSEVIRNFHGTVGRALAGAVAAVAEKNAAAAERVVAMKREIGELEDSAAMHEARRLVAREPNRLAAYTIEMDILGNLKRVYYYCERLARGQLPAGAERPAA